MKKLQSYLDYAEQHVHLHSRLILEIGIDFFQTIAPAPMFRKRLRRILRAWFPRRHESKSRDDSARIRADEDNIKETSETSIETSSRKVAAENQSTGHPSKPEKRKDGRHGTEAEEGKLNEDTETHHQTRLRQRRKPNRASTSSSDVVSGNLNTTTMGSASGGQTKSTVASTDTTDDSEEEEMVPTFAVSWDVMMFSREDWSDEIISFLKNSPCLYSLDGLASCDTTSVSGMDSLWRLRKGQDRIFYCFSRSTNIQANGGEPHIRVVGYEKRGRAYRNPQLENYERRCSRNGLQGFTQLLPTFAATDE